MRNFVKTMSVMLALTMIVSGTSMAKDTKGRIVKKATEVVENGTPFDWELLAEQADYLIEKNAGLPTAKFWIDQSVTINENSYNLEVKGDYYAKNNQPKKAMAQYLQSLMVMEGNATNVDFVRVQEKLDVNRRKG